MEGDLVIWKTSELGSTEDQFNSVYYWSAAGMVGLTELESVTSCVSSRRSNQLSYRPVWAAEKRAKNQSDSDRKLV
jgi:hypothetical protein